MRKPKKQHPPVEGQSAESTAMPAEEPAETASEPLAETPSAEQPTEQHEEKPDETPEEQTMEAAPLREIPDDEKVELMVADIKPVETPAEAPVETPAASSEVASDEKTDTVDDERTSHEEATPPTDESVAETAVAASVVAAAAVAENAVAENASSEKLSLEKKLPEKNPSEETQDDTDADKDGNADDGADENAKITDDAEDTNDADDTEAAPVAATATVVASSFAGKCFNALAWFGPLAALLLLAAQTLPGINLRALWLPEEMALPALVESMKHGADPLLLLLNGAPYPDLPPAYFWFLAGLDSLWQFTPLPFSMPLLLLGGTVISGFLLLLLTWILARVCGSTGREAFAACAVLLSTFVVCGLTRIATPDLLFAACVTASCLFLYSGWMQHRALFTLLIGFLLAGLALLIAGPVGLLLPLGASLLFLLWRGTFRRAGAADGAFGFAVLLLGIGGWLAWLGLTYGRGPAEALLNHHIPQWSLAFWSDPQRWLCDAATLAVLLLPWPFLLICLPWERLYRLPVLLWRNRKENPGVGFVWCALLVGLVILSFTYPGGNAGFAPLLPFLAVLLGRAVLRLSPLRSKLFFSLVGLALFVSAVALGLCSALPFMVDWLPAGLAMPEVCKELATLPGTAFVAGAALLFSLILLKFTDKTFPGGGLLILLLFATVAMQPVGVLTLPYLAPLNGVQAPATTEPAVTEPVTPPAAESATPAEQAVPEQAAPEQVSPEQTPEQADSEQATSATESLVPAEPTSESSAPASATDAATQTEAPAATLETPADSEAPATETAPAEAPATPVAPSAVSPVPAS